MSYVTLYLTLPIIARELYVSVSWDFSFFPSERSEKRENLIIVIYCFIFKKIEHFFFIKSRKCGVALIEKLKVMEPQSLQFLKWSEGNRQNPKKIDLIKIETLKVSKLNSYFQFDQTGSENGISSLSYNFSSILLGKRRTFLLRASSKNRFLDQILRTHSSLPKTANKNECS